MHTHTHRQTDRQTQTDRHDNIGEVLNCHSVGAHLYVYIMYVCMYVRVYVFMYARMRVCIHTLAYADMIALGEALNWDTYSLICHSFGAGVGQCMASIVPERYVCMYVYIYIYIYMYMYAYVCVYVCVVLYVRQCMASIVPERYVCMYVCMYAHVYMYVCMYVYMYACRPSKLGYVCVCVCVCIYI